MLIKQLVERAPAQKSGFAGYIIAIILIAAFLRLFLLEAIPNGFHQDEAINGYDAYSILRTSRDMYGNFLPPFVKSLNDYRESLHLLLMIPAIQVFGLSEFAVRFPSAVIGVATVFVLYRLVREILEPRSALFSALFLTLSPWHIQFSRIGYGAMLVPFLLCLGLLFLYQSLQRSYYLYFSAFFFGLALYTYASARIFVPLFLLGLVCIFWEHLWSIKKQTIIASIIFLTIFFMLLNFWISPEGMSRAEAVGLEKNPVQLIQNYLSYFSPTFLFLEGDLQLRHNPYGIGQLHLIEFLTIPVGLVLLFQEESKKRNVLWFWLLLYPIPAALTTSEHALRAIAGAPLFAILSGYGFYRITQALIHSKKVLIAFTTFLVIINISIFWKAYFIDYPIDSTYRHWRYGMKEAIHTMENNPSNCRIISNQFHHTSAFILFYTRYDPAQYQLAPLNPAQTIREQSGYTLDKYQIADLSSKELKLDNSCLVMIRPDEVSELKNVGYNWQELKTIKNPRGKAEISIGKVSPSNN